MVTKPLNVTGLKQSARPTFADPKPAEIIYKVQPSDALIKQPEARNRFLSSLKPAQSASSSVSTSVVSTVADTSSANSSLVVVTPAIALATTIKRIKLSTDQLTKIKTSSSSFGVKTNPESASLPHCSIKTEPTEEKPPESREETCREEKPAFEEIPLVYSIPKLSSLCELTTSFETVLKRLLPSCPLVDRSGRRELSATSMREYFSWPYGKRKAREWMRAVRLREMAANLTSEVVAWSTKRVVLWLRAHGHTPLEYKSMTRLNDNDHDDDSTLNDTVDLAYVNSYSSIRRLFDYKRCAIKLGDDNEKDATSKTTIDVVTDDTAVADTRRRRCVELETKRAEIESIERERNPNEDRFGPIEMTMGERFIQEELLKVDHYYY